MRRIKFRAWNGKLFTTQEWGGLISQFTGLIDRNGKEIYEGDILGHEKNRFTYEVFYNDKLCRFFLRSIFRSRERGGHHNYQALTEKNNRIVIGNIYENIERQVRYQAIIQREYD